MGKNIFMFDAESNGLQGDAFAFGAVVMDPESGKVIDSCEGRCPIVGKVDSFVTERVLPSLSNMSTDCETGLDMRNKFWDFLQQHKETSNIWTDCQWPVEARFLLACVDDDKGGKRDFCGPFPLYDLSNFVDPNMNREKYAGNLITGKSVRKHHPVWDSEVSALCLIKYERNYGIIIPE